MNNIKTEALLDLQKTIFYCDDWNDFDTEAFYNFYLNNCKKSNLHKYIKLITYKEFKYQVDRILERLLKDKENENEW